MIKLSAPCPHRCSFSLWALLAIVAISASDLAGQEATLSTGINEVAAKFVTPPDDARALMRWWWFGGAVTKPELEREILAMKAGGFGGFEIQPVYPMALDDPQTGFKNLPYLSPEFLDMVHFVAEKAEQNHMRIDLTLASGWPYGGPQVPVTEASSRLRMVAVDVPAGSGSVALPHVGNGESLIAAFLGNGTAKQNDTASLKQLALQRAGGRQLVDSMQTPRFVLFFVASRTGQQVKRAAVGAEGFVLDPLNAHAVQDHLKEVAEPLIRAFGDTPPYSVFSDSLEVYGSDWTDDFPAEFKRRRGYDLTPYLPALYTGIGASAEAVRRDWGLTQTELVDERYLTPIDDWAKAHHTRFRSQTYGEPAVSMSSNRLVALPEGEGPQWRSFSFTRWATSASHLYGRPVTSAETWTWLHSPAFRATPLDMKAEADRMFLEGVNQFVGHGWPYTPPGVAEPGWSFYAAAVFNDHTPWWPAMPEVTLYLQRLSYLLRQGKPANDVAVFLPDDDVYASFSPGHASLSAGMAKYVTPALTQQILDGGYNFDYIDAEAIEALGVPYAVLVLPHVTRMSPELLKKIDDYEKKGGKVIAVGTLPSEAPGLLNAESISHAVKSLAKAIFAPGSGASLVSNDDALGEALKRTAAPDFHVSSDVEDVGFLHRKLPDADVYFIANTSNHAIHASASFRATRAFASWWDPYDGVVTSASLQPVLDLAPYESRVLVFTNKQQGAAPKIYGPPMQLPELSHDWKVRFPGSSKEEEMPTLRSWTDKEQTRYFSGVATYTKEIDISAEELKGKRLLLDFGEGMPVTEIRKVANGMRAMLESPVREEAAVIVNGVRVGSVWHPPYALDVTTHLHPGKNHLEVQVGNLGINALAGRAPADYRLLSARYGERFVPQDVDHMEPLPSGLLGPVTLMGERVQ